jgi:hypothetical protein
MSVKFCQTTWWYIPEEMKFLQSPFLEPYTSQRALCLIARFGAVILGNNNEQYSLDERLRVGIILVTS